MTRAQRTLLVGILIILLLLSNGLHGAVSAQNSELFLEVISPGNGEHLYASPRGYIVSIPVSGQVYAPDSLSEEIEVKIEIWGETGQITSQTTQPDETGLFRVLLDLNPHGSQLTQPKLVETCGVCHKHSEIVLPDGEVQIVVTARLAGGQEKSITRRVWVDHSGIASLPVQVEVVGQSEVPAGLAVQADTRLYNWRKRSFSGLTSAEGKAILEVEALAQAPTTYQISLPRTQVGTAFYESIAPVELTLPAGSAVVDPVRLVVQRQAAKITGTVVKPASWPGVPLQVRAVSWPQGESLSQPVESDGRFEFSDLPIGAFLLTAELPEDKKSGFQTEQMYVDLRQKITADMRLTIQERQSPPVFGTIADEQGRPLPFAGIASQPEGPYNWVSPLDGSFSYPGQTDGTLVYLAAPGFWGRAVLIDPAQPAMIQLKPRPGLNIYPWGDGQVFFRSDSLKKRGENQFQISQGWVWGQNEKEAPLSFELTGYQIDLEKADFALEVEPTGLSWLWLKAGQASVKRADGWQAHLKAGEMLAFGDRAPEPKAIPANPSVVQLLRAESPPGALPFYLEPGLAPKIQAMLAKAGISVAQGVTFIFYIVLLILSGLSLIFFVVFIIRKHWRKLKV